jgi:hypothetical protein
VQEVEKNRHFFTKKPNFLIEDIFFKKRPNILILLDERVCDGLHAVQGADHDDGRASTDDEAELPGIDFMKPFWPKFTDKT